MSFLDAREHGSKVGSGGHASAQNEVRTSALRRCSCTKRRLLQHIIGRREYEEHRGFMSITQIERCNECGDHRALLH